MDADYGARYADLYRRHWWWRARERFLEQVLKRNFAPSTAGDVLDFGCGDGLFFPVLSRYGEPHGIEPESTLLSPSGPWRTQISTESLAFDPRETARYGLIVALDVLEHLPNPDAALRELRRRLRPGGLFVATVPAFQSLWTAHDVWNHHVRRYNRPELESLITSSGLDVVSSQYFFVWVAVLRWIIAKMERLFGFSSPPPTVPWGPVNGTMMALSFVEQRVFDRFSPPFGSSLLIVARAPDGPPRETATRA